VDKVIKIYGRLDILINAAGILMQKWVVETTEDDWNSIIDTNLKGTFLVNRAVINQMQKQEFGRIVNIASMAGKNTYPSLSAYAASKWGILGFTGCLAKEVARDNITVNAVCPGIVGTSMWKPMSELLTILGVGETPEEAFTNYIATTIPQGVAQTTEDIAEGILYLISAPHVTGIALSIDGGVSM
jgi:meso-butanediol dehydrogenase / (S,S)-butanediol dehydrogenase / diacetyl reductase